MRTFRHWTPRYLWNRTCEKIFRASHPDLPWLSPDAIRFLEGYLQSTDVGLEFGSGRSTIWLAMRVRSLTSVEHNPAWGQRVSVLLAGKKITNVAYHLCPADESEPAMDSAYVRAVGGLQDGAVDFALIDGIYRDACTQVALRKLRPGGLLIIDDSQRYLPGSSHSPYALRVGQPAPSVLWSILNATLKTWRSYWTSNGVSDTLIYFKPS